MIQRTATADDIAAIADVDEILNYVLFALLGVLVVRDTNIMYAGVVAGFVASLLDAIVVSAASLMVQPTPPPRRCGSASARNVFTGTVFAGLSGDRVRAGAALVGRSAAAAVTVTGHSRQSGHSGHGWCSLRLRFDQRELELLAGAEQLRGCGDRARGCARRAAHGAAAGQGGAKGRALVRGWNGQPRRSGAECADRRLAVRRPRGAARHARRPRGGAKARGGLRRVSRAGGQR